MEMPTRKLDAGSLRYLNTVESCEGVGLYGIYVERPRDWIAESTGCAILAVCVAVSLLALPIFFAIEMGTIVAVLIGGFIILVPIVGLLFTLYEFYGWRPRLPRRPFLWVDALNLWEVRGGRVDIIGIANLRSADLARVMSPSGEVVVCEPRRVELTFGDGETRAVLVENRDEATRLMTFLRAMIELRDHPQESIRFWARTHPGGLGALAHQLTFFGGTIDPAELPSGDDPPQPGQDNQRWRPPLHFDPRRPLIPPPSMPGHTGIRPGETRDGFGPIWRDDPEPWDTK